MIRRSLRIGIRLGLLTGIAFALFKIFQSRRTSPALPDVDAWAPASERSPSRPGPVLVQPTMPERSVGRKDDAPSGAVAEPPASVAPGPSEPFAMVEPDATAADAAAPDDVPLDAAAGPTVEVGDPLAVAPQAQPTAPLSAAPAPRKAPAAKAERKAVQAPVPGGGGDETPAPSAPPAAGATPAVKKSAGKKAVAKKARAKKPAATNAAAKKATGKKAAGKKAAGKKVAGKKAAGKKRAAPLRAATRRATARPGRVEAQTAGWVEPIGGTCPPTHPVKAKMATRIFHLPGMSAYHRVSADRCYADAGAAETDGLRAAQR